MCAPAKRSGLLALLAAALLGAGCQAEAPQAAVPTPTATAPAAAGRAQADRPAPGDGDAIVAEGVVVPGRRVELRFDADGVIAEVLAAPGASVEPGAPLARLDTRALDLAVERSQLALEQARAGLELLGGAPAGGPAATAKELAAAQARIAEARAGLAALEQRPRPGELTQARADLERATAEREGQRAALAAAKTTAELQLAQAANALRARQAEYGLAVEAARGGDGKQQAAAAAAALAVNDAELGLEAARVALEQARQAEKFAMQSADAAVTLAQARLAAVEAGPDGAEVAAARARVAEAEAALSRLQRGDPAAGHAHDQQVLAARAQVGQAELELKAARLAVEQATLRAPVAGVVSELYLTPGQAAPAGPAVVLTDTSLRQIEVQELSADEAVRIRPGDPASVTFEALPGLTLAGTVTGVRQVEPSAAGGADDGPAPPVTYAVTVAPERWDDRLRFRISALVTITPQP